MPLTGHLASSIASDMSDAGLLILHAAPTHQVAAPACRTGMSAKVWCLNALKHHQQVPHPDDPRLFTKQLLGHCSLRAFCTTHTVAEPYNMTQATRAFLFC